MRELEEELKKTSAGMKFLEEAEPEKQTDNLIEFAKEQCEIFPEDSYMGEYLRETLKMLQAEPCEDVVSRAELLKIYEDGFVELQKIKHLKDNIGANDRQLGVNWCINTLKELPPVKLTQRWIPVSERLPEKDVEVLATTEWGEVTIAMYCVTDWLIHEGDTNAETDEIVAWMPLPKPYKTEMESEE